MTTSPRKHDDGDPRACWCSAQLVYTSPHGLVELWDHIDEDGEGSPPDMLLLAIGEAYWDDLDAYEDGKRGMAGVW